MDLGRALVEHLDLATGGIVDVFPRLQRDVLEAERSDAFGKRTGTCRQLASETLERSRAIRGFGVTPAHVLDVLTGHGDDEVGVGEVAGCQLAAAVIVGPRAQCMDGVAGAPAHRHSLDHVSTTGGDHDAGDVLGHERTAHNRPGGVPGAQHDDVRHSRESMEAATRPRITATVATTLASMAVDVRPARSRFHTELDWLDSWHSFSFGPHRDPANTHHGLLLVNNDDVIQAGGGFGTHGHRNMEIVTWVLDGALEHRDSIGTVGLITPGLAQRMSAGSGIRHSEVNASSTEPVHLVQMWVPPDTDEIEPSYEQRDLTDALASGVLIPVASGQGHDGAVTIRQRDAALFAGRLAAGTTDTIPDAPHVHVFVARGAAMLGDVALNAGDAARVRDAGTLTVTAAADGAAVLVWVTA